MLPHLILILCLSVFFSITQSFSFLPYPKSLCRAAPLYAGNVPLTANGKRVEAPEGSPLSAVNKYLYNLYESFC